MWTMRVEGAGRHGTVIVFDGQDRFRYSGPRVFDALLWVHEQGESEIRLKGESGAAIVKIVLLSE